MTIIVILLSFFLGVGLFIRKYTPGVVLFLIFVISVLVLFFTLY